ncbi:hypothetical protein [Tolypothrix sp. VBCCA 56010]|uniref:hypothetical protein n=1 Tax=Tolypothrix sp. VBCCA 56010 TaxID=3137731 RepID=UPI003D7ECD44
MSEHAERQQQTAQFIADDVLDNQKRREQAEHKKEAAKQTYEGISKGNLPHTVTPQQEYDTLYKYHLGEELKNGKGKDLERDTDAKIAQKIFDGTQGKADFNHVREAIKEHSSLAATMPEQKKHEYASAATTKGLENHLKNIPREEKTRVQSHHQPDNRLSQEELYALQRHRERE